MGLVADGLVGVRADDGAADQDVIILGQIGLGVQGDVGVDLVRAGVDLKVHSPLRNVEDLGGHLIHILAHIVVGIFQHPADLIFGNGDERGFGSGLRGGHRSLAGAGLDEDALLRSPVHLKAQGGTQIPQLVVGIGPSIVIQKDDGLQSGRGAVDVGRGSGGRIGPVAREGSFHLGAVRGIAFPGLNVHRTVPAHLKLDGGAIEDLSHIPELHIVGVISIGVLQGIRLKGDRAAVHQNSLGGRVGGAPFGGSGGYGQQGKAQCERKGERKGLFHVVFPPV